MTMMRAFGRCHCLVVVAVDVSDVNDGCTDAADVGEGVLTPLLLGVSSPPSPSSPPRCDDDLSDPNRTDFEITNR